MPRTQDLLRDHRPIVPLYAVPADSGILNSADLSLVCRYEVHGWKIEEVLFIHFDGDDVGSALELILLDDGVERAREYSAAIRHALILLHEAISVRGDADIFVSGGDDLIVFLQERDPTLDEIEQLRRVFFESCGRTMSVGVGHSAAEASHNLRRAKLMGKNVIVTPSMVAEITDGVGA